MSCNTKTGPKAAIELIEFVTDEQITQTDWHSLRLLAAEEGLEIRRGTAPQKNAEAAIDSLGESLRADLLSHHADDSYDKYFEKMYKKAKKSFVSVTNSPGTVSILTYLANNGTEGALSRMRSSREGDWEPEVQFLATKPVEELDDRLVFLRNTEGLILDNERDFGYLNANRLNRIQTRIDAVLDARSRAASGVKLPGKHG